MSAGRASSRCACPDLSDAARTVSPTMSVPAEQPPLPTPEPPGSGPTSPRRALPRQTSFDELGSPLHEVTFVVVDLETTGGSPTTRPSPRSARSRCAAARCSASSRPSSVRAHPIPPFISVLTGHHRRDGRAGAADRDRAPGVPRLHRRRRPRGPQRAVRRGLPARRRGPVRAPVAVARRPRHRAPGPSGAEPRRGARLQAQHARPALPGHHRAQPPGAVRRPRHRRRAARAHRAGRHRGRPVLRGAGHLLLARLDRPAPQAASRRGSPPRPGGLRLPGRSGPPALHRQVHGPAGPGPHLLHRQRDTQPHGRDGRPRRVGPPHPVRDGARGRGPRAADDRRAQAALQPPVALPRARRSGSSSPSRRSRDCRSCARSATTARPTSDRSVDAGPPSRRSPPSTRRSRSASAPRGCRPRIPTSPCVLAEMGRCGAPCAGHESVEDYSVHVDGRPPGAARGPVRPGGGGRAPHHPALGRPALRGGRRPPRPAGVVRPHGRPRPAHRAPSRAAASSWPPALHRTRAGRSRSSGTHGWPAPRAWPARRRPLAGGRRARSRPARSCPTSADAGGHRRGVGVPAALARRHRHPARPPRRHVGVPGSRRGRLDRPLHPVALPASGADADTRALARPFGPRGVTVAP